MVLEWHPNQADGKQPIQSYLTCSHHPSAVLPLITSFVSVKIICTSRRNPQETSLYTLTSCLCLFLTTNQIASSFIFTGKTLFSIQDIPQIKPKHILDRGRRISSNSYPRDIHRNRELFLVGRSWNYDSAIGPCHLSCSELRNRRLAWEIADHFSIGVTKGRLKVDLPSILSNGIVLSWVFFEAKLRDRLEVIDSLTENLVETAIHSPLVSKF
ncbi:hypothetical protein TNCV_2945911 [Trichonephila clavipes]|nr:hypothetical protein TNCV_2945911 [Trichonephila clavipes]